MTTIAWDGLSLVADGLTSAGGMVMALGTNKILICKGIHSPVLGEGILALASSGYPDTNEHLKKWLLGPEADDSVWSGGKSFSAIVIKESKTAVLITKEEDDPHISITPLTGPYAIGHGRDFAMGALLVPASSEEAVSVASRLDPFTGGVHTSFSIGF